MNLAILRHGETEWNRAERFQGELDSPLTDLGRAQAVAMGQALAAEGITPASHRLWCSPQGRAMATAALAFPGAAPRTDPRLAEIGMGAWQGLTRAEIALRWPGPPEEPMMALYARCPGGEPFAALWARVCALLAEVDGPAILVTHGMTSRFLRAAALGLDQAAVGDLPGGQGVVHHLTVAGPRLIPVAQGRLHG